MRFTQFTQMMLAALAIAGGGCSSSGSSSGGSGGSSSSGGTSSQSGGGSGSGGHSSSGGAAAGASGGGGSGGSSTSSASGGAAGGAKGSGGLATTGGTTGTGTGGSTATGGQTSLDAGSTAIDGSSTGGITGSGGKAATGGTTGTGTGGSTAIGGTGAGGNGTGGNTGTSPPSSKSPGCGKTSTITDYNKGNPIPITVNGSQRRYILQIPANYDNGKPYKFILAIHALNSNDKSVYSEKFYGLQPLSKDTVIFAAPNGVNGSTPCSGNSAGDSGCGWPSGNNNMELMDAVTKQVTENFCVDMDNIYATGWSYGASMSYEVGCQRPRGGKNATWGVRAIALYAGAQMSGQCKPSTDNPVAFYESHGTHDSVLCYDSASSGCQVGGAGGVGLAQNWSNANGCTWQTPTKVTSGNHVCTKMAGCKDGYPVEFCSFNGDHVAFPDSNNQSNTWGPQEVWTFFSQF